MSDYTTYAVMTVAINGSRGHRQIFHRELNAPPLFSKGMFLEFRKSVMEVSQIGWDGYNRHLTLYGHETIYYHNQGPAELSGEEKKAAFFDNWVTALLDDGWIKGNPPRRRPERD